MLPRVIQIARVYLLTIGEEALEIGASLAAMVMIERFCSQEGLGIYCYLFSLFVIARYLSDFGIAKYAEREIALNAGNHSAQSAVFTNAYQAAFLIGLASGALFIISSAYNATNTLIEEKMAAYIIIGVTIPFSNVNKLKLSVLHALGQHERAAKVEGKKLIPFLGFLYLLLVFQMPPSYLILSLLAMQISLTIMMWGSIGLTRVRNVWSGFKNLGPTLKQGRRTLFTDESLEVVLYADFLILGFFVSSHELGVYAEAVILARFFLLIPISIRPIFRRRYCLLASKNDFTLASSTLRRRTALLFFLHSLLALYVILHFSNVLHLFFHTQGGEMISFRIFLVILPGLLFFSALTASEPVYEAEGRIDALQKLVLGVSFFNLCLNLYLVPYAGSFGAATATMASMAVYFLFFGRGLRKIDQLNKWPYIIAGASVYILYKIMEWLRLGIIFEILMVPVILFFLLFLTGFFDLERKSMSQTKKYKNFIEGGIDNGKT